MTREVSARPAAGQLAVLMNPAAGRGRHRDHLAGVLERLAVSGRAVHVLDARTVPEALAACRDAIGAGVAGLVTVGGDGTVHLGLQAAAGSGVPFGVVPAGTGNDFAIELGLPTSPLAAAEAIGAALREGTTRAVDLARMTTAAGEERWYGAVLAAGFDAIVNERANRMSFPKGPRRYDIAIVAELMRLRPRPYLLRLDGVEHRVEAVLVAVGNTRSYGGGMRICPDADPADGMLDIVVGARMGRVTLMRIKPSLYRGTHVEHPLVTTYRAREVEIAAEDITGYADGERIGPLPATITCVPGALRVLAPA